MTDAEKERAQALRAELDALAEEARQAPPGPDARDPLRTMMERMRALTREAEELTGEPVPAEIAATMADIQQMLDHWDELGPLWEAFRDLETALGTQPRTRETVESILDRARALRATLDTVRALVPASYYEAVAAGFDPLIAALTEALSQPVAEGP